MVNVNIEIPDDLHKLLKLAAITNGTTLKDHIVVALDDRLRRMGR